MADHVLVVKSVAPLPAPLGELLRERGTVGIWEVSPREWKAYYPEVDPDIVTSLRALFPGAEATWLEEEAVDWAARYQAALRPLPVGRRFALLPSPELDNPWPGRLPLRLYPGTAFGTGEHYTTASCLRVLENIAPLPGEVLDVGCGTGVLAAAACLLGARRVVACDTDPEACRVSVETARLNGVDFGVVEGSAADVPGSFGLLLANILAETLVEILPDIAAKTAKKGLLIGSGILVSRGSMVLEAATAQGFALLEARTDGAWWTYLWELRRPWSPAT